MKIPSLHTQMFGDVDRQLNQIRKQWNIKIRQQCLEKLAKKKEVV